MYNKSLTQRLNRIIFENNSQSVASPVPGEAPSQVTTQPVLTEPTNTVGGNNQNPSIYELYPDLINLNITSACELADYFSKLCETEQFNQEIEQQRQITPSFFQKNTPAEFN